MPKAKDDQESSDNPVVKWTIFGSIAALVLVVAISTWLAFSVSLDSFTRIDPGTDRIHIRGVETDFVGYATGEYQGHPVLIEGLPDAKQLEELPLAWRAICVVRDDPETDWSKADPMLKVHLHSDRIDEACRPFE